MSSDRQLLTRTSRTCNQPFIKILYVIYNSTTTIASRPECTYVGTSECVRSFVRPLARLPGFPLYTWWWLSVAKKKPQNGGGFGRVSGGVKQQHYDAVRISFFRLALLFVCVYLVRTAHSNTYVRTYVVARRSHPWLVNSHDRHVLGKCHSSFIRQKNMLLHFVSQNHINVLFYVTHSNRVALSHPLMK